MGKAILAHSSNDVVDAYLASGLVQKTATSYSDPGALLAELSRIRVRGAAYDDGEAVDEVTCVAAPIFERGDVRAAVSVCAVRNALDVEAMSGRVRAAAIAIERRLHDVRPAALSA